MTFPQEDPHSRSTCCQKQTPMSTYSLKTQEMRCGAKVHVFMSVEKNGMTPAGSFFWTREQHYPTLGQIFHDLTLKRQESLCAGSIFLLRDGNRREDNICRQLLNDFKLWSDKTHNSAFLWYG